MISFSCLPQIVLLPIAYFFPSKRSLDPTDAASPRYDSAATLSPWHPLGWSGSQAHSATRVAIIVAALLREALLVVKLLLAASPAFDRSLARRVRVSFAGYPLANIISIHSRRGYTPLDYLESSQIRSAARPIFCLPLSHTRDYDTRSLRESYRGSGGGAGGREEGGREERV